MAKYEPVEDVRVSPDAPSSDLIELYGKEYGFMAGHLWRAAQVLAEGLKGSELRVLSFTGNLISTGLRGVITQLIRERLFNVVITTCGALDHDIARATGGKYLKGFFEADDVDLARHDMHRLGNVFIRVEDYGPRVEKFVRDLVARAVSEKEEWGLYELLKLAGQMIEDKDSFLRAAYEADTDVFVPGWADGAFGTDLFFESQRGLEVKIDYFKDMKRLADLFFGTKGKATALIIGGGISKHHAIWWSQFRGGLDYVVYVTTAVEWDGSLSGAMTREAITWGKVKPTAKHVTVYGDATIILPLLAAYLLKHKG
ncbi:MAG: deoxyhypusine synthase [Acidilobus sp.]|jgi:deoxyhypusine synthase